MSSNIEINKNCLYCGKEFTAKTLVTRYCGHTCNRRHYKQLKREEKLNSFKTSQLKQNTEQHLPPSQVQLQQKEFLSIEETARLIGTSRRTICRLIASKKLKVVKVGRRSIIQRSEIDKLFKQIP